MDFLSWGGFQAVECKISFWGFPTSYDLLEHAFQIAPIFGREVVGGKKLSRLKKEKNDLTKKEL